MAVILGIDPGTHRLGWGIVSGNASKQVYIASGCIESKPGTTPDVFLPHIYQELNKVINQYHPTHLGLESLLFQKNISTAIPVAEARGVIRLAASINHLSITESAPNSIKLAVAGSGSANKFEVTRMVGLLLGIEVSKKRDDELDALAVAISTLVINK